MMFFSLPFMLAVGAALFCIGLYGVLVRREFIFLLMAIEIMLAGVSLTLVSFSRHYQDASGQVLALFSFGVVAAESAVGLAILIQFVRTFRSTDTDSGLTLRG